MNNFERLKLEIVGKSESDVWEVARSEWILENVYHEDRPDTCLCGHFPIIEICEIKNKLNDNFVFVGNVCVKRFLGLPSDKIFQSVKRIRKENEKSLNIDAIEYAYRKQWINDWEYEFCKTTYRKRKLTQKQSNKRIQINQKILKGIFNARKQKA